ncbi:Ig-like domain-containing protein [Nocardia sp. 348MFTsu5.1]|uniref:L,D-transpeptidase n=1 Tax=Nocardia sp. 348MFTsu5.1 TaxID=1172185 RepID=UPI00068846B9|nr:Ig-like domain-containing protein [Nocardia sp. 348MFTsu5.1]
MGFRQASVTRRAKTPTVLLILLLTLAGVASACSSAEPKPPKYSDQVVSTTPFDDLLQPAVEVTGFANQPVIDGDVGFAPGAPVQVVASDGRLTNVQITNEAGTAVPGVMSDDQKTWTVPAGSFGYNKQYTLVADAKGIGGTTQSSRTFTTSSPNNLTQAYLLPDEGSTVGVGMPVSIRFDESIPNRKAAQDAITIKTDPPTEGAFYWLSDTELRWRPENYWKPGTKVDVEVNTYGIDLGDGLFGQENLKTNFTIGRELIAVADDNTKMITISENGNVIKTMPTSMGKDSTPTNNGTYIIGDRLDRIVMDSSTYGVPVNSPAGYKLDVDNATQMSWSGIYIHSAPWSVYAQGSENTSHGCLNVSPENALWWVQNSLRGDIVTVKNTIGDELPGTDGLGDWNIPWETWKAGNA